MGSIERIERLEPVFDPALLADEREAPALGQRRIDVGETRSEQNVSSESAERVRRWIRKTRLIEIRIQLLALRAAGVQDRVTLPDEVGTRGSRTRRRVVR